jgi:peptidoglycan/xylan/chitin deacetylase (PgdA/CDA1 family)
VALTFDDGYNFDHRILDFLSSEGIKATAFVIGSWAQNNPSLLREMDGLGWEICNHTQNHPWLTKIPDQQIQAELNACQAVIASTTGQHQPFFRPPGGFIDARVNGVVTSMGYIPVLWSMDSMDALGPRVPDVQSRVAGMVNGARDGSIILFHFGGRNTLELVQGMVKGLQQRGFCFVTLGELYGMKNIMRGGECGPGQAEAAERHYFAEGTTRPGYEEWLLVLNPGEEAAEVEATFFSSQGRERKSFSVPARGRISIDVNSEVPWRDDLSVLLESSSPTAAERMLYFRRGRGYDGASMSAGTQGAATRFYFAEGSIRPDFEEWLALFNPSGAAEARVELEFFGGVGALGKTSLEVPPQSRVTVKVNDLVEEDELVGGEKDLSMILKSSQGVVAERSQYFVYDNLVPGANGGGGCCQPRQEWYFAEGTTRRFFYSYLVLFNPCRYDTPVKVSFLGSDGESREESVVLAAGQRRTLKVNERLPEDIDYSVRVSSLLPIVAERSTYFRSRNTIGGYCQVGTPSPRERWLFPEGCTSEGYQEWLALFNPTAREQEVSVDYLLGEEGVLRRSYTLPAWGRVTVDVAAEAGRHDKVAMEVRAPAGIIAERSLYFTRASP